MDKHQAQNIIKETFEQPFDKVRFTNFIKNLLNRIDESKAFHAHGYVKEGFRGVIKTYERVGTYTSADDKKIDIIVVYLQKGFSIDRARVTQRNFAGRYLADRDNKNAGLFAFVSPEESDWRFSLVKMDYKFEQSKSGGMKVKEEFTPARRWSFLVGKNEKSHTAQSRLVKILAEDETDPTLEEIEKAFDIETVTKEFFLEYRELFLHTKEELDKIVTQSSSLRNEFEAKGVDTVNFAKKLLGQIIFLYFLQKKGWFGVGRDDDWGSGSKQFLRELFSGTHGSYQNFFNDILEPLFYEALRIGEERKQDDYYYSRFNCKIPFLNGGLFDPIGNYDWVHTDILLQDELFSNQTKTKEGLPAALGTAQAGDTGTGILDVFDRYNFTVREDEPLEKEVAIDPELLGKAYEKFNAIRPDNFDEFTKALKSGRKGEENKFNKKFGVYYTPREIVHYMCKQSLINYLHTKVIQASMPEEITRQDIEDLIEVGEMITEHEATALIKEQKIKTGIQKSTEYTALLSDGIRQNAKSIDDWLADITVCDPAAGSGAFPVGMMNEIVRARNVLSVFVNEDGRSDYEFKRRCIEHSLYGVDIDPGAVEIAKLRLWLSLVVDEEDIKNIKPLPNLDYKIVCGNSLLGVEKGLFNYQLFNDLEKVKPLFFSETNPTKKQAYKKQIDDLIRRITNGHTEFDFEVYFSEVFHKKGGFDVVIANPPYLKERDNKKVFQIVNNSEFGKKYHQGKMDYWYYFLHKAIEIAKKNAAISFITSRYWLNSSGAKKIINHVSIELSFDIFVDIGKLKVFEEVEGQHMVAVYKKSKHHDEFIYKKLENEVSDIARDTNSENLTIANLSNKSIFSNNEIVLDQGINQSDGTILLGEIVDISQGVVEATDKVSIKQLRNSKKKDVNAGDGVFVIDHREYLSLNLTEPERKVIKKYLDPNDVFRYSYKWTKEYLIYSDKAIKELIKKNPEYSHLKGHLNKMREFITSSNRPYGLHRPRDIKFFTTPKILFKGMFVENEFAYDENNHFVGFSFSTIIQQNKKYDLKFILAILNSRYALHWFWKNGKKRGAGVDIGVKKLRQFPIKIANEEEQKPFVKLVERILAAKHANPQADTIPLERKIDQMVYELYGLTEEDIRIVEGEK